MPLYVEAKYSKGRRWARSDQRVVVGWHSARTKRGHSDFAKEKCNNIYEEYRPNDWVKVMIYDRLCCMVESRTWCLKNYVAAYDRELERQSGHYRCSRHRKQK